MPTHTEPCWQSKGGKHANACQQRVRHQHKLPRHPCEETREHRADGLAERTRSWPAWAQTCRDYGTSGCAQRLMRILADCAWATSGARHTRGCAETDACAARGPSHRRRRHGEYENASAGSPARDRPIARPYPSDRERE